MNASSDPAPRVRGSAGRDDGEGSEGGRNGLRTLFGLQYLRAVAACSVVCFHAASRAGYGDVIGQAGVDLFFVLSGFLMVVITNAQTRPLAFLADRIARIVPLYWIVTTVMLVGMSVGLFTSMGLTPAYVAGSYAFVPVRMPYYGMIWPLLVQGWTLNYEMAFYAVFAVLLWLAPRRVQLPTLTIVLAGVVAAGIVARPQGAVAITYSDPMMLEFAAGGWIGLMWKRLAMPRLGWAPLLGGLAVAGYGLAAWRDTDVLRVVFYGVPALLLLAATLALERRPGGVPRWRLPALIGDASYSIYLWHTFAVSVVVRAATAIDLPAPALMAAGIVVGVGIGMVGYWILERPLLRLLKRRRTVHGVPIPAGV